MYIYNYMYTVYSMYMYVYFYTGHYILYIYNIYIRSHTRRSKESPALEKWCIRCIRDNCTDLYTALFIHVAIFVCYRLAELVINGLKMVATAIF